MALVIHAVQVVLRLEIYLVCSAFPSVKHFVYRAPLVGRQPTPAGAAAALHELLQGKVKPETLLEELLQSGSKLHSAHWAYLRDAERTQPIGVKNGEDVGEGVGAEAYRRRAKRPEADFALNFLENLDLAC